MSGAAPVVDRFQTLTTTLEKSATTEDGSLTGVACTYNYDVPRGWGLHLRVLPGSFAAQVRDPARVKMLWQHTHSEPIGSVWSLTDGEDKLKFTGQLIDSDKVPNAQKALALLRAGVLDEVSVGFEMLTWTVEEEKQENKETKWTYIVSKARLREISVVTFGAMGDKARVTDVHHETTGLELVRAHAAKLRGNLARLNH